ncbi:MAG TPA: hypothetical protein VMX17_07445 [Candidatus Glassbacteria bacterium]|nr:hypothetical protein [Candidatus Glassbacteria bacterium]
MKETILYCSICEEVYSSAQSPCCPHNDGPTVVNVWPKINKKQYLKSFNKKYFEAVPCMCGESGCEGWFVNGKNQPICECGHSLNDHDIPAYNKECAYCECKLFKDSEVVMGVVPNPAFKIYECVYK